MKKTKGFVLQIQQGAMRDKSDMQVAEEMQSGWLQVPRIGYFAFPVTDVRGASNTSEKEMDDAIKAARAQWHKGVAPDVEMISEVFEPLEGELCFNDRGDVEGPARVTFPDETRPGDLLLCRCPRRRAHLRGGSGQRPRRQAGEGLGPLLAARGWHKGAADQQRGGAELRIRSLDTSFRAADRPKRW